MITLDPAEIAKVDTEALEANLDARAKVAFLKPIKIDYTPRHKMKGRGSAMKQVIVWSHFIVSGGFY
jgi:hypothetical protein